MTTLLLLYPERRHISTGKVLSWGFDQKVNDAVDAHVRAHGPFSDEAGDTAYESFVAGVAAPDLAEAIEILEDAGVATFGRETDEADVDDDPDRYGFAGDADPQEDR